MDRRKKCNRSSRDAILWWAGTFLVLQAGLSVSLDTWLGRWRDPNYARRHQCLCQEADRHPGRPVVVVVGSSRTMNGLCPSSLPDDGRGPILLNWGFPGHAPVHLALRVERLLREGPRPEALVIEVAPAFLTTGWAEPGPLPVESQGWSDLPTAARLVPGHEVESAWRDARLVPWFSYRQNILEWAVPAWLPSESRMDPFWRRLDEWGWFPTMARTTSPESRRRTVAEFSPLMQRAEIHPDQARALRSALSACRREEVRAAVLLMPESPEFQAGYGPGVRDGLCAALKSLCDEFGCELIDARNWFPTEDVFCDGHHLLPEGARRFTARFAGEVVPRVLGPASGGPLDGSRRYAEIVNQP